MQGILNIHKPEGISSYDVIRHIKRVMSVERKGKGLSLKIGHAGTLDPFASGVLLVLIGRATKCAQFLMDLGKVYEAVLTSGFETDTADRTGKPSGAAACGVPSLEQWRLAARGFEGEIDQVPPIYSALRVGGRRLYHLARQGKAPAPAARRVEIKSLEILSYEPPRLHFRCSVGRGFYVRSLAVDWGRAAGSAAHLESLSRTAIGPYALDRAVPLKELRSAADIESRLEETLSHA